MVCDNVLHCNMILKIVKLSVKNKKLVVLSNKFSKQKFVLFLLSKNNSGNNFYAVLI